MMQIKLQYCRAEVVILIFFFFLNAQPTCHILKLHLNLLLFSSLFWEIIFWGKNEYQSIQPHAAGTHPMNHYYTDFVLSEPFRTFK